MRDDLLSGLLPHGGEPIDPVAMARRDMQKNLPRRFYKTATVAERDGAFAILLDGRPAKTPARHPLALPTRAAAEALAGEWNAQGELIDPALMPLTRIVNSALDGVGGQIDAVVAEIAKYGGSDLVCYRAADPEALVRAQAAAWDPLLVFAREGLGARLICAEGVIFVEQPAPALAALRDAVAAVARSGAGSPIALAALHVMTTLTGSLVIALAVVHGEIAVADAWRAAHVDEDFQMQVWGADEEALRRRERRWVDMEAAANLWRLVRAPGL